jgi:hypothetical protein
VGCFSTRFAFQVSATIAAMIVAGSACVAGDGAPFDRGGRPSVYQRQAFDWTHGHGDQHGGRHRWERDHRRERVAPQVSAGWFQRPYPYHLDYYRMRYGGSYAPYFGNLYGPPQVVTAPPYYGPYYGGYDMPDGYFARGYGNGGPVEPNQQPGVSQSPMDPTSENAPPASAP